jgi:tetratricopeptide (TPR) repeat protein
MLGDLNDKLAQLQRLDIMEAVDDKAMNYFQSLPDTDLTDTAREQRAKALEKIGSVRIDQGHLSAALDSYRAAVKITAELARAAPTDSQRQLAWAHDLDWIGRTHWSEGELAAAGDDFSHAQRIIAQARRFDPANVQLRYEDAVLYNNVGHVLEAEGQLDESAVEYTRMLELCREQVKQTPRKEWLVELGAAHNNLGKLALMRGDLTLAVAEYRSDDKIESELAARDPKDNDQRENVVTIRAILGRTLALTGDIRNGMRDLEQSVGLARQLSTLDPQNTTLQEDVAHYESQLARLRRLSGDLAGARSLTAHSLVTLSALTSSDPDNIQWRRELAEAQTEQAAESLASRQPDAAEGQSRSALRLLEPLRAQHSHDRQTLLAIARARLTLAAVSPQDARQLQTAVLAETESASSNGYGDPRLQALRVEALLALERTTDAQPLLAQLSRAGYRDLELLGILQRAHVPYPVPGTPTEAVAKE